MDVAKVVAKEPLKSPFLYFLMRTEMFKQHCVSYANGTTVLHLPRVAVPQYQVILPKDLGAKKVTDFNAIAEVTVNKLTANIQAIQALTATRESLLPRLMSGEIRVSN